MEAVQSTTYCPASPKCSTRQTAARPQTWGNGNSPALLRHLCPFPSFQVQLAFFICLVWYLSLSHSLSHHPYCSILFFFSVSLSFSPSFCLSPEREKQTVARVGLADEFQMTLKGKGADRLSPGETAGNPIKKNKTQCQININMVQMCICTQSCTLNQYGILNSSRRAFQIVLKVDVDELPGLNKWLKPIAAFFFFYKKEGVRVFLLPKLILSLFSNSLLAQDCFVSSRR